MEFEKNYGLIRDEDAVKETVEVGLSFERAAKNAENGHAGSLPNVPEVSGVTVALSDSGLLPALENGTKGD